jgi:hypothetical protein
VFRRIFGPKRDEVTGGWRKLHNEELGRACSTNGEKRNVYTIFVGKPEGKTPLGTSRRRWVNNIKMDLREIEMGPVEGSCEHGNEPSGSVKCWEVLE